MPFDSRERRVQLPRGWPKTTGMGGRKPPEWVAENHQNRHRLATVIVPGTRDVQPSFVPVAKHYGAIVEPCPPRRGNRKGVVESSVRFVSGRWWRTMTETDPEGAQRSLDRFCETVGDAYSDGCCTPVPIEVVHRFRRLLYTAGGRDAGFGVSERAPATLL